MNGRTHHTRTSVPNTADVVPSRGAKATAWLLVGVLGPLPAITADILFGSVRPWLAGAQLIAGLAVLAAVLLTPSLREVWRFAVVLLVLAGLLTGATHLDLTLPALASVFGGSAFELQMLAGQTAKVAIALLMIGLMLALGFRPREFFLTLGNLTAPIRPVALLGFPHADTWRRFGLIWGFGIAAALGAVQHLLLRLPLDTFAAAFTMAPAILFYAAVNAFSEEMTYRAPMVATAERSLGWREALWMSAVFFGVAHYFGIPGGALGALLSIFMGWILSKAMIETRGLFWSWCIHFLSDVVIFTFVAIEMVNDG